MGPRLLRPRRHGWERDDESLHCRRGGGEFGSGSAMPDRYVLPLIDSEHPEVCLIPTAGGDAGHALVFHEVHSSYGCDQRGLQGEPGS